MQRRLPSYRATSTFQTTLRHSRVSSKQSIVVAVAHTDRQIQPSQQSSTLSSRPRPRRRTNSGGKLAGAIGFSAAIDDERSQAGLDWITGIIGSSQSIPPPLVSLPCSLSPLPSPVIESHRMPSSSCCQPDWRVESLQEKSFKTCKSCVMIQSEVSSELEIRQQRSLEVGWMWSMRPLCI